MAKILVTFKNRTFPVNIENATELYISEIKDYFEKSFKETENKSQDPDTFSNAFHTGIMLAHEIKQLKEQIKKLEGQTHLGGDNTTEKIDAMILKINAVFNK